MSYPSYHACKGLTSPAAQILNSCVAEGAAASPYDKQLAVLGHRAMLKMMLQHNFIHSDLHPGNIMVQLDPPSSTLLQSAARLWQSMGLGECD